MPATPATFDQSTRLAKIFTPLPAGEVVLLDMHGNEYINDINAFYVRVLTGHDGAEVETLLGQPISIEIETSGDAPRFVHQVVDAIRYVGPDDVNHIYELELRPWLWMLGRRFNSRIFKEKSILDIIKQVVQEYGLDPSLKLKEDVSGGAQQEYLVQYDESDLDFVRRLLEREGINFHCEMAKDSHTIVLSNRVDAFPSAPGPDRAYSPLGDRGDQTMENFETWAPRRQLTTGATRMTDYNFKTPKAGMEVSSTPTRTPPFSNLESFVYPGNYPDSGAGKPIAKNRADAFRMADATVVADGNATSLGAGMKFKLSAHPDTSQKDEYVVTGAHHSVANGSFNSGQAGASQSTYRGSYQLIRASIPIAPIMQTPRPRIVGPQTGVVVDGADGKLDEFGRITVKFFWAPDAESMRCRVSQIWAANDWGSLFIPHAGMEVIVEFMDGDPDHPLVTGCVWNADNHPTFPADNLVSGFVTVRSNRLLFSDKEGKEEITIRAQKDMWTIVEHDLEHTVNRHQINKIKQNMTESVGGDVKTTVSGKEDHKVTGALTIESTSKIELKVGTSSITIEPAAITIKALTVTVEAQVALTTKGGVTAEHSAGAVMTIKGAMVMIN